jgi:hypothetical protein
VETSKSKTADARNSAEDRVSTDSPTDAGAPPETLSKSPGTNPRRPSSAAADTARPKAQTLQTDEGIDGMANPTEVNGRITDAVTQTNVKVVAEAPAIAMGNVYQAAAHSSGILMENAVAQHQSSQTLAQTTVAAVVAGLVSGN